MRKPTTGPDTEISRTPSRGRFNRRVGANWLDDGWGVQSPPPSTRAERRPADFRAGTLLLCRAELFSVLERIHSTTLVHAS
jgi:hypothetical protein